MSIPRPAALTMLALVLVTAAGVALAPLAKVPGAPDAMDSDFVHYMEPRLRVLLASSQEVEGMVTERSRNVLALRAESERINALIEQIDVYLADRQLTREERAVADHYHAGADKVQRAIDAAYTALSSFDFSAMPAMIPVFADGTRQIEDALRTLQTEHEAGSSYTVDSVA